MSDSSLSDPPADPSIVLDIDPDIDSFSEPTLPPLLPMPFSTAPRLKLPHTVSPLFLQNLYQRTLLLTVPPKIQIVCLQPNCGYTPLPMLFSDKSTE
ncbi:hypothetical protein VE02_01223 [Pseudogymnoascus sp. 03VT05]|nr:hypothetical protein VE02_01223 [Pseudogymnoascus sp. 03VT05]